MFIIWCLLAIMMKSENIYVISGKSYEIGDMAFPKVPGVEADAAKLFGGRKELQVEMALTEDIKR